MKNCKRCQLEKDESCFYKKRSTCKDCCNEIRRIRQSKPEYKAKKSAQDAKYYRKNSTKIKNQNRQYQLANPDKYREYRLKRRDKRSAYLREYYKDPVKRLTHNLRVRLNRTIKGRWKAGSAVALLGCSIPALKVYLEALWLPGMTWDNWGPNGWHIDHKIPLAHFDLNDPAQLSKALHFTNLQPLWGADSPAKGDSEETIACM